MIAIKIKGLDELAASMQLTAREIVRAARSTVDTTATAIKALALSEAEKHYTIKKSRLTKTSRGQETIYVKRSNQTELNAVVTFKGGASTKSGDRPGLQHYASKASLKRKKGSYPKYRIKKDSAQQEVIGGFYTVMPNGGEGIFERIPGTKKIARRTGPGIKQIVENEPVNSIILAKAQEILHIKMVQAVNKIVVKRK